VKRCATYAIVLQLFQCDSDFMAVMHIAADGLWLVLVAAVARPHKNDGNQSKSGGTQE
jgi:hypothetical protein